MNIGLNGRFYGARVTGVQRFAREIAARLPDLADLRLFLPRNTKPPPEIVRRVPIVRGRLAGHVWEQLELPVLARRAGCDVLLHLSGTASVLGGPHVTVVYDVIPLSNPEWFSRVFALWYRVALGTAAKRAVRVLTISGWERRQIVERLGIPPDRIDVVSQGLDPFTEPASPNRVQRVRDRFGLPETYVLTIWSGDPRKNLPFLLEVMDRWCARDATVPVLAVVGDNTERVHGVRSRGAPRCADVRFLGYVTDAELQSLYTGATVFCFPSRREGFGRPPLEALACGTPVLVGDYGPAVEVLGERAAVLPPDPERWVDALHRLVRGGADMRPAVLDADTIDRFSWARGASEVVRACERAARGDGVQPELGEREDDDRENGQREGLVHTHDGNGGSGFAGPR